MYNCFKECDLGLGTHYLWNSLQANFIPNTSQLHELKIFQNTSKYSKAPSPRNAKTRHFGLRYRLRRTPLGHVGPFQHTEKTAVLTEKKHSPKRSRHVLGQVLRPLQICSLPKIFSAIRLHLDFVPIQIEHVTMTLHSRSFQVYECSNAKNGKYWSSNCYTLRCSSWTARALIFSAWLMRPA